MTGGKFANGAMSAAFRVAFNDLNGVFAKNGILDSNSDLHGKVRAKAWDNHEVLRRWSELYSLSYLTDKYYRKEGVSKAELDAIYVEIEVYRDRLMDISWFML